ncbi:RNA-dependent ATPase [Orbilia ellipsospora]|uniref:RNA helicase n=1 Tax=Orbilia ellipsospora TaxID=2528407 RepID=A0AAV9XS46_9PEZI
MGKKRKAAEADDDMPAFTSQANAPPEDPRETAKKEKKDKKKSSKKRDTEKSSKPRLPSNHDPETNSHAVDPIAPKPDFTTMNVHELKLKPENEKKEDKYARQKEPRKRKKEEKEKLEGHKAEVEGKEDVPPDTKKEEKKRKKEAAKLAKKEQPGLSKAEKKILAEERKDKKRKARKEAKRAEKLKAKAAANGETEVEEEETTTKVTITQVEEVREVTMGDAVERIEVVKDVVTVEPAVEDKMEVDSDGNSTSSSDSSDSDNEKEKKPAPKSAKSNGVTNGAANGKKSKKPVDSSSDSSNSSDSESEEATKAPKVDDSTAPTTASGTQSPVPVDSTVISSYMTTHAIKITDPKAPDTLSADLILNFSDLPAVDKSHLAPFSAYKTPTPIQAASWSYLLAGRDLIGVAETGSGKTMAFAYPAVQYLSKLPKSERNPKKTGAKVVIVSPTRELAMQIFEQVEKLTIAAGMKDAATCIYGGVPKDPQRDSLSKALVIVATPGRLNDFLEEGSAKISQAGYVVLDEADRMLDKGFEDAIKTILGATPATPKRQTLMFTATWPQSVRQLASTFMTKPIRIGINSPEDGDLRANTRITQTVEVLADGRMKESRLLNIINAHQRSSPTARNDRILVFALYKKEAARLEGFLRAKGIKVGGIHGDLNQTVRTTTLAEFKSGKTPVLVATDVAARGLDIPNVKLVINVTFPLTIEDYVHRIGRTGRAGEVGKAMTFFTDHDKAHSGGLINILKAAKQNVPEELMKFGTTVKKKEHASYGAFYRDTSDAKTATKIKFDE